MMQEPKKEDKTSVTNISSKKLPMIHKISDKFSTEKLMMMLDKEKLEALEEEFAEHPEGIELTNFVWLMKCAMNHFPEEKYDLVHGLCRLFAEIDINGDKHMEWTEFTQYIIDAVMQTPTKINESKKRKLLKFVKGEGTKSQNDLVEKAHSQKFSRLFPSKIVDRFLHDGYIQKAIYCAKTDEILTLENISKELKLYGSNCKPKQVQSLEIPVAKGKEAFALSIAYNDSKLIYACTCSDNCTYLWEYVGNTNTSTNYKLIKKQYTKNAQYGIWYAPLHDEWITASRTKKGKDRGGKGKQQQSRMKLKSLEDKKEEEEEVHVINEWELGPISIKEQLTHIKTYDAHKKTIMDMCELKHPLSIATCSLDQTIKIWDLNEQTLLGTLCEHHKTGIRSIDYTPDYGGNIISVGHENYINVWSPEVSIIKSYVGKLEGHNAPVISAKFITKSPYAVSIDDKLNLRIWDIRTFVCMQIISQEKSKFVCHGLVMFGSKKKFAMYGRRLIFFDTVAEDKSTVVNQPMTDDIYAFHVQFNNYYNNFVVVTKMDVRIFDGKTGQLVNVLSDVTDKSNADITAFAMDDRHRKFYLGDTSGSIRTYNVSNGLLIKKIGEKEYTDKTGIKKTIKEQKGEISHLHFVNEDKLLISTSWDTTVNIYDETEPEESVKLRTLGGGHKTDITAMAFSEHLSLIATGSSDGTIAIWDYEMSRLEGLCVGHTKDITCLAFLGTLPALVSASLDTYLSIWPVRTPNKNKYTCIACMKNIYQLENSFYSANVPAFFTFVQKMQALEGRGKKIHVSVEDLKERYVSVILDDKGIKYKKFDPNISKIKKEKSVSFEQDDLGLFQDRPKEHDPREDVVLEHPDRYINRHNTAERITRSYIYTGDEKGMLRIWDITPILEYYNIYPIPSVRETKPSFNPNRKEDCEATSVAAFYKKNASKKLKDVLPGERQIVFREWEGHRDSIIFFSRIEKPNGFITSSYDKHIKIWSLEGEKWGDINLARDSGANFWQFPFDWKKKREEEKREVIEVLDLIEEATHEKDMVCFDENGQKTQPHSTTRSKIKEKEKEESPVRKKHGRTTQERMNYKANLDDSDDSTEEIAYQKQIENQDIEDLKRDINNVVNRPPIHGFSGDYSLFVARTLEDYWEAVKSDNKQNKKKLLTTANHLSKKNVPLLNDEIKKKKYDRRSHQELAHLEKHSELSLKATQMIHSPRRAHAEKYRQSFSKDSEKSGASKLKAPQAGSDQIPKSQGLKKSCSNVSKKIKAQSSLQSEKSRFSSSHSGLKKEHEAKKEKMNISNSTAQLSLHTPHISLAQSQHMGGQTGTMKISSSQPHISHFQVSKFQAQGKKKRKGANKMQQRTLSQEFNFGRKMIIGFDACKNGNGKYLQTLKTTDYKVKPAPLFGQELDVKYSSGEGLRQMNKAITRLNFQKHSKIQNYNNADNEILQNQKHSLETFSQFKLHKFNESQKFKQPKFKPNSYLS